MKNFADIATIERFIFGEMSTSERLLFEARLLLDSSLRMAVKEQQKVYRVASLYGRRKLKMEIEGIHRRLFSSEADFDYRENILDLFKKQ